MCGVNPTPRSLRDILLPGRAWCPPAALHPRFLRRRIQRRRNCSLALRSQRRSANSTNATKQRKVNGGRKELVYGLKVPCAPK